MKQIIEEVVRKEMERVIKLIENMFLTPEEKKLLENVKEKIKKKDYSEFIPIENLTSPYYQICHYDRLRGGHFKQIFRSFQ